MKRQLTSFLYILFLLSSKIISVSSADFKVNYGEALQKSLFFYEAQQAGVLPEWNEVSWRGNSVENDFVPGGWFDAGDHFKFTLTIAYTSALLAWGYIEYGDAVNKVGLEEKYKNNLKWGLDYIVLADQGGSIVGTIGKDGFDHSWWGSPEIYLRKMKLVTGDDERPYDESTSSSTLALSAAALAAGYIIFKDSKYLTHAKSLYSAADSARSNGGQGMAKSYYPATDFYDELFYAANWMYMATGDDKYLEECEKDFIPQFPLEQQSETRKFTWGFCWDDHSQAAALLYAINTGKEEWIEQIRRHLEYWTTGYEGKQVKYTPDGLAWLFQWGATRHAANTAFLAVVAADRLFKDDKEKYNKYKTFAKTQMDYFFGNNKLGLSYVLGMGDKNPKTVHHRGASGIHDDSWTALGTDKSDGNHQTEYAHILYGALEGGPNADGSFTDKVSAYENTEVAIDYNAGFTACLCSMINDYGGTILKDFPQPEKPKWPEFLIHASLNGESNKFIELKVYAMNHSAWPARVIKDLSYNYYFDITELIEGGLTVEDIGTRIGADQHSADEGKASISKPIQYKDNIYYVKISYGDGRVVMPSGQSDHRGEIQFRIFLPDSTKVEWDSSNDYSYKGLTKTLAETPYITMYDGDKLIWGTEPDGTTPESA
jgi:hypothetical protein